MNTTVKWAGLTLSIGILAIAAACGGGGDPGWIILPEGISDSTPTPVEEVTFASSGSPLVRVGNVEELISRSQIIFVGTVASVAREHVANGYGDDGVLSPAEDIGSGYPFTDYVVEVDRLLKGDGLVVDGGTITLRMSGHLSGQGNVISSVPIVLPNPGDRCLFALWEWPDSTYGSSADGLIEVDGASPVYIDGVSFPTTLNSADFLDAIAEAVAGP